METATATPTTQAAVLAINGGPRAFAAMTGKVQLKVGITEFFSIAGRFKFKEAPASPEDNTHAH